MLNTLLPAAIMFLITIGFSAICFIPMTLYNPSNKVASFYWSGLWLFLALISGLAGGGSTLMLLGIPGYIVATQVISTVIVAAFVVFVVFGWFHVVGVASFATLRRVKRASSK